MQCDIFENENSIDTEAVFESEGALREFSTKGPSVPPMSDLEVIGRCREGKRANHFMALYEGKWETLDSYKSLSEAQIALCEIVTRHTSDQEQIRRLVAGSGLNCEEWYLKDYREHIIKQASQITIDPQKKYFCDKGSFLAKSLADELIEENHYITLEDTREIYVYDNGVYRPGGSSHIMSVAQAKLQEYSRKSHINEVIFFIQNETLVSRDSLNNDKNIINLRNGLYDIRNGEFMPHDPAFLSTVQIPQVYDSDAKCPAIDKFFSEVVSEDEEQKLREVFAYGLTSDRSIQQATMLVGSGANGKSVALNLLQEFIGLKHCSGESLQQLEESKFSSAKLYDKLLNVCPDIPNTRIYDNSVFKQATGNDRNIRGENKNKPIFYFENTAHLVFSANDLPEVPNANEAYFRRWNIIDFPNQFKGKNADRNLIDKLTTTEELSGLLNSSLKVLKDLLDRGEFSHSKTAEETERYYLIRSNNVAVFAKDCISPSMENTEKPLMYKAYVEWCSQNNVKPLITSKFNKQLKKLGYNLWRKGSGDREYVWEGVSVGGV
jgi:putative DNA primase/helicase